jgi:hypothetical protein
MAPINPKFSVLEQFIFTCRGATIMTDYPIIANCNYESAEDTAIHEIRKAVDAGLTDDQNLLDAMDELESVLTRHAEDGGMIATQACAQAEAAVLAAWTDEVRDAVEAMRLSRCSG